MSNEKMDVEEMTRSLTGFDEIAIEQAFKKEMTGMSSIAILRALMFVQKRRDGASDFDAFKTSMEMPLGELNDLFEGEEEVVEGKA